MKALRVILVMFLGLVLAVGIVACGDSDSDSNDDGGDGDSIVGTWAFVVTDDDSGEDFNLYFDFNSDGTFEIYLDPIYGYPSEGGTYSATGNEATLTFTYDGNGSSLINDGTVPSTETGTYSISGDTLTFTGSDGETRQGTRVS